MNLTVRVDAGTEIAPFPSTQRRRCSQEVEHIMLALGGSDTLELTWRVCEWLRERLPETVWRITVLLGNAYRERHALRARIGTDNRWRLQKEVTSLCVLMETADIGIFTADDTLNVATITGLPTLSIAINSTQERTALALERAGATRYLGHSAELTTQRVLQGLDSLLAQPARQQMADVAQTLQEAIQLPGSVETPEGIISAYRELRRAA